MKLFIKRIHNRYFMTKNQRTQDFFKFAKERYKIFLKRQKGAEPPWTNDEIIQYGWFCNIFREDDKTTKWVRAHLKPERHGPGIIGAFLIARLLNRIPTLERVYKPTDLFYTWQHTPLDEWGDQLRERLQGITPLITSGHLVSTPPGLNKLDGIIKNYQDGLPISLRLYEQLNRKQHTLQAATDLIQELPYVGSFMSYELVTDLRHTPLLNNAPDICTWAKAGPGAGRGLSRIEKGRADWFRHDTKRDQKALVGGMKELLDLTQIPEYWWTEWPQWEMREVEHTLCEFDKYERVRLGEGNVRRYYDSNKRK